MRSYAALTGISITYGVHEFTRTIARRVPENDILDVDGNVRPVYLHSCSLSTTVHACILSFDRSCSDPDPAQC